ncbi:RebB family R body protein [Roseibium sp.]|uniref:RebB family R body protein n=1 Tax=Roseibium sp. TaxID=1936156 RepID=UPI003A97A0E5
MATVKAPVSVTAAPGDAIASVDMSPAVAMASLYVSAAHSNAILYSNSVQQAKLGNASAELAVLGGLMRLYDDGKVGGKASITEAKNDLSDLVKLLNTLG